MLLLVDWMSVQAIQLMALSPPSAMHQLARASTRTTKDPHRNDSCAMILKVFMRPDVTPTSLAGTTLATAMHDWFKA